VVAIVVVLASFVVEARLREGECEVCIKVVNEVRKGDKKALTDKEKVNDKIRDYCKTAKDSKENRFCYYIGGTVDSATGMLYIISEPITKHVPTEKICERTKDHDLQICELRYAKKIDLKTLTPEAMNKMRVNELKNLLQELGGTCSGCTEKSDYVAKIQAIRAAKKEL